MLIKTYIKEKLMYQLLAFDGNIHLDDGVEEGGLHSDWANLGR